jgi:catechol 2,3-dioxygenase-like lactoylglutathione lyase family enzyme
MRLSPQGWADLALHAPDQVWIAAMFERQRAAGIHACVMNDEERHRAVRWEGGR